MADVENECLPERPSEQLMSYKQMKENGNEKHSRKGKGTKKKEVRL